MSTKREGAVKFWTFTAFSEKFDGIADMMCDAPYEPPQTVAYCQYSAERAPNTGRIHLQGFLAYKKRVRMSTVVADLPRGSHVERMRGTVSDNLCYTSKPESHVAGPWKFGEIPVDTADCKKSKWESLIADVKSGVCERDLYEKYPSFLDRCRGVEKAISLFAPTISERHVDVFLLWGPACTGKSYRCKQAFPDFFEAHGSLDLRTFMSYRGQKTVIVDAFLSAEWPMTSLEGMIKDAVCDIPVMYGAVKSLWTTFIITTNQHPDSMYSGAVNRGSLMLRIKKTFYISAREDKGGEKINFSDV